MSVTLVGLAPVQLERIADGLSRTAFLGDVRAIVNGIELTATLTQRTCNELQGLVLASSASTVALVLRAVAAERRSATLSADRRIELVWTGPERDATATRDTAVVVRELFESAEQEVLVAGYAIYNARSILEPLARRMMAIPRLRVRLVLNIGRGDAAKTADDLLFEFARRFRLHHWPTTPLPSVYFDPRAFEQRPECRAVMHAKCVLVDGKRTFVTSANLTEAAQIRNVELGVVINDVVSCRSVTAQFDGLIASGELIELKF